MSYQIVNRTMIVDFLRRLDNVISHDAVVYLVGETTQVFEGWREWSSQLELAGEVREQDRSEIARASDQVRREFDINVFDESPADVIPLPDGYESRAIPVELDGLKHLRVYHFDPYSVVLRFIARGDEPDYHMALVFIEHGWVKVPEMDRKLAEMIPRLTVKTIQQDPAELRRKYKGLLQMWHAVTPRTTHRPTPV